MAGFIHSRRTLGVFALVMINVIAVDSLRSLPFGAVYGFSLVFYYLVASIGFFLPSALVATELATAWPAKGGIYVWVREAFGPRAGLLIVWLQWIYNVIWYPTILAFMAGAVAYLFNPALAQNKFYMVLTNLSIFWGATLLNFLGMRAASWLSTASALLGSLLPMALIIGLGVYWYGAHQPLAIAFTWQNFWPDLSNIHNLVFLVAVIFGLMGMELSATHADQVQDPSRAYPRAIVISLVLIFVSLVGASLAIALVVPAQQLNVITGLEQAFHAFFLRLHWPWMNPVITFCIVFGALGIVSAWIIGPTKGLLVAARDGSLPEKLARVNRKEMPVMILLIQALIFSLLSCTYLLFPTVAGAYWLLSVMTSQLALLVYIGLFAAGIYLRYKYPQQKRGFKIPGGKVGMWIVASIGIITALVAISIGFLPPAGIQIGSLLRYEIILMSGIILAIAVPLVIYRRQR